jgi:hypothetical protein
VTVANSNEILSKDVKLLVPKNPEIALKYSLNNAPSPYTMIGKADIM